MLTRAFRHAAANDNENMHRSLNVCEPDGFRRDLSPFLDVYRMNGRWHAGFQALDIFYETSCGALRIAGLDQRGDTPDEALRRLERFLRQYEGHCYFCPRSDNTANTDSRYRGLRRRALKAVVQ